MFHNEFNRTAFACAILIDITKLSFISKKTPKAENQFRSEIFADNFQVYFFCQNNADFVDVLMPIEVIIGCSWKKSVYFRFCFFRGDI